MKSDLIFSSTRRPQVAALGVLAMAAALPASSNDAPNDSYTWSAELIDVDQPAGTVTVQSRLVSNADVDFKSLDKGDRVTLTWSGISTAAGVRRVVQGDAPDGDVLTLPIEFVSPELDDRYVRFKVAVPSDDLAKIASLQPGSWITATSPRRAADFREAVVDVRPYNDVG